MHTFFSVAKKIKFPPISRKSWMFLCSRFITLSQINNKTEEQFGPLDISYNILQKEQFISLKVGWTVFNILSFAPIYFCTQRKDEYRYLYYTKAHNYRNFTEIKKISQKIYTKLFAQFLNVDPCVVPDPHENICLAETFQ